MLADLGAARLGSEWAEARIDAAGGLLAAILAAAGEIMPTLTKLAEEAIRKLVAVADLGGAKLDDLVRAGRTDDAQAVANAPTIAAELDSHYDFRDRFLVRGGPQALTVGSWNASRIRDPVMARHHVSGSTPAERYIRGLTAGVPLWFPTRAEAIEVAQGIAGGEAAKAAKVKAQQHGVGSVAAF